MATISTNKLVQVLSDEELLSLQQAITKEQTHRHPNKTSKYMTTKTRYTQEEREHVNEAYRMQLIDKHLVAINQGRVVVTYDMPESETDFLEELKNVEDVEIVKLISLIISRFQNGNCTGEAHIIFPTTDCAKRFLTYAKYKLSSALVLPIVD